MTQEERRNLEILACKARIGAIIGTFNAKSGHPGGSLSAADMFTYLYFKEMNVDPQNPAWADRDRFVLSKGHCCPSLYAVLALKGYFAWEELSVLRHVGAMLQGHPDMKGTPGIDMSSGSLGQGISAACGMALAAKLDKKDYRVYTVLGDGECEEGEVWEAAMFAGHKGLDNLTVRRSAALNRTTPNSTASALRRPSSTVTALTRSRKRWLRRRPPISPSRSS